MNMVCVSVYPPIDTWMSCKLQIDSPLIVPESAYPGIRVST